MPLGSVRLLPAPTPRLLILENFGSHAIIAFWQKSSARRNVRLAQDVGISTILAFIHHHDGRASRKVLGTALWELLVARNLHRLVSHIHNLPLLPAHLRRSNPGISTHQRRTWCPALRRRNGSLACPCFPILTIRVSTSSAPIRVQVPATTTATKI